jgi:hypothetical protein
MTTLFQLIEKSRHRDEAQIGIYCQKCYTVSSTKDEYLRPFTVLKLIIPIIGFKHEPRLMRVHNHLCSKPWRVLTQYVYITKHTPYVTLLLVSPIKRRILPNEEICHLSFSMPEEALYDIKGKYSLFLNI